MRLEDVSPVDTGASLGLSTRDRRALAAVEPRTVNQLHAWLRLVLDIVTPREPVVAHHASPMDYLADAFFAGAELDTLGPRDAVVWASRGSGKTFYAALATTLDLLFKPGVEVMLLGGSFGQSQRMHRHLRALFDRDAVAHTLAAPPTERGLRLASGSAARLLAQSETSVRGARPQILRCDEAELFSRDVWTAAQLVTRSALCGGRPVPGRIEALSTWHEPTGLMAELVRSATNDAHGPTAAARTTERPPDRPITHEAAATEHAPRAAGYAREQPNAATGDGEQRGGAARRRLFRWSVLDVLDRCAAGQDESACAGCALAPECGGRARSIAAGAGHVPPADAVRAKHRTDAQTWESEMLCLPPRRAAGDDAVYPEFDPERHIDPYEPTDAERAAAAGPNHEWIGGIDFGYRNPTVILWALLRRQPDRPTLHLIDELVRSGATIDEHAHAVLDGQWPVPTWFGVDPAGHQRSDQTGFSPIAVLRKRGLVIRAPRVALADGLRAVRSRLRSASGAASLLVHPRCVKLIDALARYRYPPDAPTGSARRAPAEQPLKDGPDHACDALRYLVTALDLRHGAASGSYI